jgi:type I restriction enzyme S subunit
MSRVDRIATVNARIGWKALTAAEYQPGGYAFLATPNIKDSEIDFDNVNYISEYRYNESPELKLRPGDILLAKDGNTLGIVNVVRTVPHPATVNGSIAVLRPFGVEAGYLRYVIASGVTQGRINSVKDGMGVPHLFQWDIKRLAVPLPPVEEQHRIADFLDAETARIDRLVSLRTAQVSSSVERERSALDAIFKKAGNENSTRLKYLFATRPRYGVLVPKFSEQGIRFIRVNDLLNLEDRFDSLNMIPPSLSAQYPRTVVRTGDLLISVVGTLGRSTVASSRAAGANIARAVCSVRVLPDVEVELVQAWLGTSSFHRQASIATSTDTAQPTLGMEDLGNFELPWPADKGTRQQMLNSISTMRDATRTLRHCVDRQLALLAERRQALITAAVTGQFDVTTAGKGS